jgi:hypothetical protein
MARGRRLLGQLVLVLAVMAAAFAGAKLGLVGTREVGASHNFTDVPDGAFFHDFVDFLVDTGITAGCGPLLYCPDRAVTRGEQAVFLKKFLTVGSMPQVVDASGRLVGRTTQVSDSSATVALSIQNRLIFVPVAPGGFQTTFFPLLFYPGVADCSGQGFFISVNTFAPASPAKVAVPGHTAYVPNFAAPQMFNGATGSADGFTGGCNPNAPPPFTGTGFPAIPLVDLDTLGFQTPFGLL